MDKLHSNQYQNSYFLKNIGKASKGKKNLLHKIFGKCNLEIFLPISDKNTFGNSEIFSVPTSHTDSLNLWKAAHPTLE